MENSSISKEMREIAEFILYILNNLSDEIDYEENRNKPEADSLALASPLGDRLTEKKEQKRQKKKIF